MQPRLHTSIFWAQGCRRMTSGARYHRVMMHWLFVLWRPQKVRAIPKSQIFISQSWLIRMFAGFKSRCIMLAEWRNFNPQSRLQSIIRECSSESSRFLFLKKSSRLYSSKSITRNIEVKSYSVPPKTTSWSLVVKILSGKFESYYKTISSRITILVFIKFLKC